MQTISGFDFLPLKFEGNGNLSDQSQLSALTKRAASATDLILLAHGFRNDEHDATLLYTNFLTSLRSNLSRPELQSLATRNFVIAGILWPSKPLPESFSASRMGGDGSTQSLDADTPPDLAAMAKKLNDLKDAETKEAKLNQAIALLPVLEDNPAAQDEFAQLVLTSVPLEQANPTEGVDLVKEQKGSEMFQMLQGPVLSPAPAAANGGDAGGGISDEVDEFQAEPVGGVRSFESTFGSILGGVDKFINLTTFIAMKTRAGTVGQSGVAQAVRSLKAAKAGLKIHLVGHSLGGCLMASCANALAMAPMVQPDSVMLLEAAFSHYGFSPNNGTGQAGFYRGVITNHVIKGPLVDTFSGQDQAVGTFYALIAHLVRNSTRALGDADDLFGGLGRNGAQKTPESASIKLRDLAQPGSPYTFPPGVITSLDGSGGLIKDHSDITNENVTYAFACSVAST